VVDDHHRNLPQLIQLPPGQGVFQIGADDNPVHPGIGGHFQLVFYRINGMYGNSGVHLQGGLLRPFDNPGKKGITVIRQVKGKMVIDGRGGFRRGLYVEITDQVKGTEKGSQGEETKTDYTRPEKIFHPKEYGFFGKKSEDGRTGPQGIDVYFFELIMGAFLTLRVKNRAFRSNSSKLRSPHGLRNFCGISATIPCAEEGVRATPIKL
jgi:hypothetical protein